VIAQGRFVAVVSATLFACKGAAPPSEPPAVRVEAVDASPPVARADAGSGGASLAPEDSPIDTGWIQSSTYNVEPTRRDAAIDVIRRHPVRTLVAVSSIVEECSSTGGAHVFLRPASTAETRFKTAHLGGHGVTVPHDVNGLLGGAALYVAAVETHPPSSFGNGRGWCLEKAPPYEGDVLAMVPVRSEAEGNKLLARLAAP
jgi:hypothetical protein